MMRAAVVERPIDVSALIAEIASPSHGASVVFIGTVRDTNDGMGVTGLDYTAYREMAERELQAIISEAAQRWSADAVVEHRVGTLDVGEASVAIVIGHAHRGPAYEASRYVIEELKKRLPVWKREHYVDGGSEWVAGTAAAAATGQPAREGNA